MSSRTGRNESCPCGSGLKYKRCCALKEAEAASKSGGVVLLVLLALVGGGAIFAAVLVINGQGERQEATDQKTEVVRRSPSIPVNTAAFPNQLKPQPPGPVPESKVWSPEHGHWHDVGVPGGHRPTPTSDPSRPPGQLTPQPPGPVPEGKVWSPEHGHWHNANQSSP